MSLITPLFLIGLAAVALPVLFHLVRRAQAKTVPFSSLMFLQATTKEQVRKRRLRDILLLLLRCALLALLALAFARPFFTQEAVPFFQGEENQSVVLLIDRSYSMQYGDGADGASAFDQARTEALNRLDAAGADDEFAIIAFSDEAQLMTSLGDEPDVHRNVLENALTVSNRPTDLYRPLRLAEDILADARHENRQIVLISDFQQYAWGGSFENWKLNPDISFVPVKIGDDVPANHYIEAFDLTTRRAGEQVAVRYSARVRADGEEPSSQRAALTLDGAALDQQTLPARASNLYAFQQMAPREGVFQGDLALSDDALTVDNRYYFTYPVESRPSLLCIDGGGRNAMFLRNAFDLGESALYRFTTGTPGLLSRTGLRDHHVVFLTNVAALTTSQLNALQEFVESGGGLVISLGPDVNAGTWSNTLETLGLGRLTETVNARAVQQSEAIIGEVDLRHPVFNVFASAGTGSIFRPQFRRYMRLEPDSAASVIGAYDTGDPFLVERRVGQGTVLVYTSTLNTSWTDFPINELYVPFVYQVVKHALGTSGTRRMFIVGDPVVLEGRPGETWDVRAPGNRQYKVTMDDAGTGAFRNTDDPGQYMAVRGTERFAFSVNVDPREADLQTRDAEEAYATVVPPLRETTPDPQTAAVAVEDTEKRQQLWRYLILLALALFATETILANRKRRSRLT